MKKLTWKLLETGIFKFQQRKQTLKSNDIAKINATKAVFEAEIGLGRFYAYSFNSELKMKHLLFIAILLSSFAANAANFSFTGNLDHDDDFRTFGFTVDSTSNVTIRTWSYSGGTNSDGALIPAGGFDPLLVLFDSTGTMITWDDDINATSGLYDSLINWELDAGNYIVALAQFGTDLTQNPTLAEIVWSTYYDNFDGLTSFYALDINNVSSASVLNNVSSVPLPAAVWLFGSAFMGLLGMRKKSV